MEIFFTNLHFYYNPQITTEDKVGQFYFSVFAYGTCVFSKHRPPYCEGNKIANLQGDNFTSVPLYSCCTINLVSLLIMLLVCLVSLRLNQLQVVQNKPEPNYKQIILIIFKIANEILEFFSSDYRVPNKHYSIISWHYIFYA